MITEWDEDYERKPAVTRLVETRQLETKPLETKPLETMPLETKAGPDSKDAKPRQRIATQLLLPQRELPFHNVLKVPGSLERDNLPVNQVGPPLFSANNRFAPRASEPVASKAYAATTKKLTDSKKSKQGWAEHPGLITTRKGNQIALDAASNKYLGHIPENTDFNCTVIVIIISTRLKLTYPGIFRPL